MRKWNAILTMAILVLFIVHAVLGVLNLMGVTVIVTKYMAWVMVGLIAAHAVLSTVLTVQSLIAAKRSGAPYFRQNRLFWARRLSGYLLVALIFFHVTAFGHTVNGVYRLTFFEPFQLTTQILLAATLALHLLTNIKPMLISFGIRRLKPRAGDILFFLSILLIAAAVGFIIYFIRWNVV